MHYRMFQLLFIFILLFVMFVLPASADEGAFSEYPIPTQDSVPQGVVLGPDGAIWFAEYAGGKIGRIDENNTLKEYPLPASSNGGVLSPYYLTVGPDNAIWFTDAGDHQIGRLNPADGSVKLFPLPDGLFNPRRIITGPDGNLWFTLGHLTFPDGGNRSGVARMTTGGQVTFYPTPQENGLPEGITATGNTIWYVDAEHKTLVRLSGGSTEFDLGWSYIPQDIVSAPDGNIYITSVAMSACRYSSCPPKIEWYNTSGVYQGVNYLNQTGDAENITRAPDGTLWFTQPDTGGIGHIDVSGANKVFTIYKLPRVVVMSGGEPAYRSRRPVDIAVTQSGKVFFSEETVNSIGKFDTAKNMTEFIFPPEIAPVWSTEGPDSSTWTTSCGSSVMRVDSSGRYTEYEVGGCPGRIIDWPDDSNTNRTMRVPVTTTISAFGFTMPDANLIGKITITGTVVTYTIPTANSEPRGIAKGSDGAIWFTEYAGNKIGRLTITGTITEYPLPAADSMPQGITAGPDGTLWFTESAGNKIGRVLTTTGAISEFTIPAAGSKPQEITRGPDGAIWFTTATGKIGRITTAGAITLYDVPGGGKLGDIMTGTDKAIWFTDITGNRVGRMTTGGDFSFYLLPTERSAPLGLVQGPDGKLWIMESNASKIAVMDMPPPPAPEPQPEPEKKYIYLPLALRNHNSGW